MFSWVLFNPNIDQLKQQLMSVDSIYKFNKLYALYLAQETHFLFKYEKKLKCLFARKNQEKSLGLTDNIKHFDISR